jgi:hypothetical protein
MSQLVDEINALFLKGPKSSITNPRGAGNQHGRSNFPELPPKIGAGLRVWQMRLFGVFLPVVLF